MKKSNRLTHNYTGKIGVKKLLCCLKLEMLTGQNKPLTP